jgi:hypothetical protein
MTGLGSRRLQGTLVAVGLAALALTCGKSPTFPSGQNAALTALGVTANVPSGWSVRAGKGPSVANISNVQKFSPLEDSASATESLFQVRLLQNANLGKLPMDQWFAQYFVHGFDGPIWSQANRTVGGRPAFRVEASGVGRWSYVYVGLDSDVIELSFEIGQTAFVGQYETLLNSVQFSR